MLYLNGSSNQLSKSNAFSSQTQTKIYVLFDLYFFLAKTKLLLSISSAGGPQFLGGASATQAHCVQLDQNQL